MNKILNFISILVLLWSIMNPVTYNLIIFIINYNLTIILLPFGLSMKFYVLTFVFVELIVYYFLIYKLLNSIYNFIKNLN
jgi:hypothetical protein